MKTLFPGILAPILLVLSLSTLSAQQTLPSIDSLIEHSLRTFDLPRYDPPAQPDTPRSRLGIYSTELPADTLKAMPGWPAGERGFRIWHLMPNWPADLGGLYIGDIILTVDGRQIGDSIYPAPDDFIAVVARDKKPGDTVRFRIYRDGQVITVPVQVWAGKSMRPTPPDVGALGPIRDSWLAGTLARLSLDDWSKTIRKQIRAAADVDFSTVEYAGRPTPWRLSTVSYLEHYPLRTGAVSRMLVDELWKGRDAGPGLSQALLAMSRRLDLQPFTPATPERPRSMNTLRSFFETVLARTAQAYAPVGRDAGKTAAELAAMLNVEDDSEIALEQITDRLKRRARRVEVETGLAATFTAADRLDRKALFEAGAMLASLADTNWLKLLGAELATGRPLRVRVPGVAGDVLAQWTTPAGQCVIGGAGANHYDGAFALIIDLGGNDQYALAPAASGTARLVVDLAGDDLYQNDSAGQGSGIGAVDVLIDGAGNDLYRAASWAQGAGVLGIGILADMGGDDFYLSHWASQGAGFLGAGVLYDASGNDSYAADIYAQGFGYAWGFGAILDETGNDSYKAGWKYEDTRIPHKSYLAMSQGFGFGMRPWGFGVGTDGGIGVLADRSGDDLYASDFFSQGCSYWYALGVLYDRQGSDRYTSGQYAQGSGIHLSFGALLDDQGDDTYDTYAGLEQGNAHDWSAGCLEDFQGNDTYRGSNSSQGSALNVSFAWLFDSQGNDGYYCLLTDTTQCQGGGNINPARKSGSMGMLVDEGSGNDYYVEQRVQPGTPVIKPNRGIIFDDGTK